VGIIYDINQSKLFQNNFNVTDTENDMQKLCEELGGEVIKLRPGTADYINPMDLSQEGETISLSDNEKDVINYLRNPVYACNRAKQGCGNPLENMSNEELLSLYIKMDTVIENEGNIRRALGCYDEIYVLELTGVKDILLKEYNSRC